MSDAGQATAIGAVIEQAQGVIAAVRSELLENTATAQRAESEASDALGALERAIQLLNYERSRQHETARRRAQVAAEREALQKQRTEAEERKRHTVTLLREEQREKALKAAREYLKKKGTT